jgi:hypothetical protein
MPINIRKATAKCVDCGVELVAPLTIEVWDFGCINNVGVASGNLQQVCARHHDDCREWLPGAVQHSEFMIFEAGRKIGEMTVSSMGYEHRFIVTDRITQKLFHEEIRRLQRDSGYIRW